MDDANQLEKGNGRLILRFARRLALYPFQNSRVKDYAWIASSIIGWNSTVGRWVRSDLDLSRAESALTTACFRSQTRLDNTTVLGDDVNVKDELTVFGASVLPHKSLSASIYEPAIVMVRRALRYSSPATPLTSLPPRSKNPTFANPPRLASFPP